MKTQVYLLVDRYGNVEPRKRRPDPHFGRVAIRLSIEISDSWFTPPTPIVEVSVPDAHVLPAPIVRSEPLNDAPESEE